VDLGEVEDSKCIGACHLELAVDLFERARRLGIPKATMI
jgi:hypothetical protein